MCHTLSFSLKRLLPFNVLCMNNNYTCHFFKKWKINELFVKYDFSTGFVIY